MEERISAAIAKIDFEIEYADTHGGCPPAVKGTKWTGISEAKAALLAAHRAEMSALLERVEREVIGEDYEPWYETSHNDTAVIIARKNELRAEQRTALAAIKAEVEGKEYDLQLCTSCGVMTNHLGGVCQKHASKEEK